MSSLAEVGIGVLAFYALGFVFSLVVLWYTVRFIRYAWDGNTAMLKRLAGWALGLPVLALILVRSIQWAQGNPDQARGVAAVVIVFYLIFVFREKSAGQEKPSQQSEVVHKLQLGLPLLGSWSHEETEKGTRNENL